MRLQRSLNGRWQFQLDPEGTLRIDALAPDREIQVPMPWQAAFPELERYSGYAWYETRVVLDEEWLRGRLLLSFGAVDYWCEVFVNGQRVGEHEGGYTSFTVDITASANPGENQIAVRVYDSAQTGLTVPRWPDTVNRTISNGPPFDAHHVPHGKQDWYLNVGGIWQDVTLTAVPATYIQQVHITPDIHGNRAEVEVTLGGAVSDGARLAVNIEGNIAETPVTAGQTRYRLAVSVPEPRLWTPDTPELYNARVRLVGAGAEDEQETRFGFREISTRDGELLLNGQPFFLLSALDQDFYPDTIYTVPSEVYLRDQFAKAKALGLNSLRCHIKLPDPRYLDLADEMGLLIWAEIPSWRTFSVRETVHPESLTIDPVIKARVWATLEAMIARDFNHPSLMIWTIVNEDWGTSLALSAADRAWVSEMYDLCKQLDPTRLVVDNSACGASWGGNVHVKSDLDDFHVYTNIPDKMSDFVTFAEQLDARPLWTYSNHGDAQRTGHEPLILSEFGNWGLPSMSSLKAQTGREPDWFKLGSWWASWDGEPSWARGVEARFAALGLNAIWPDYETFATATQWHQYQAMKFEIETIRRLAHLKGYVITEFTDVYWESNGLLDFYRATKVYQNEFATINAPDVLIPQFNQYAFWDDQRAVVNLFGSHFSGKTWENGRLSWSSGADSGEMQVKQVARGRVGDFGRKRLKLTSVGGGQMVDLAFRLTDTAGAELARNATSVLVLPVSARRAAYTGYVTVMTFDDDIRLPIIDTDSQNESGGFAAILASLGYKMTRTLAANTGVLVTNYPTPAQLKWVRGGGAMLYLSEGTGPFFWRQGRGGVFGGSWITSFSWLRPGVYRRLPADNPLKLPFANVMPTGVILGLPMEDAALQQDYLAGQVTGWVRHPALHTVQFRYGEGRVIMTTYALRSALGQNAQDVVAVAMLHDLIDHLVDCQPTLAANF